MSSERLFVPSQYSPWKKRCNHLVAISNRLRGKFSASPPRVVRDDVEKSSESDFTFRQPFQVDLDHLPYLVSNLCKRQIPSSASVLHPGEESVLGRLQSFYVLLVSGKPGR